MFYIYFTFVDMKRFYLPSILSLIMLALIFRHSQSEEDTTPSPSILATPEPEPPAPKQYILTVTRGEGEEKCQQKAVL